MVTRPLRNIAVAAFCLLSFKALAETTEPSTTNLRRWETVTIGEHSIELVVRFDRPISHQRSWLFLVRDGKVVETIYPRLEAAPNVLFARIQTPPAGNYIVRWTVCPEGSNDRYIGEFSLTVDAAHSQVPGASGQR
jgi:hypothetical protein